MEQFPHMYTTRKHACTRVPVKCPLNIFTADCPCPTTCTETYHKHAPTTNTLLQQPGKNLVASWGEPEQAAWNAIHVVVEDRYHQIVAVL